MYGVLLSFHILVCIALVASVLLQSGKGGGLAGGNRLPNSSSSDNRFAKVVVMV